MRELVELGLSAKQQKADRFEQIKREAYEMIKARISTMKSKVASPCLILFKKLVNNFT